MRIGNVPGAAGREEPGGGSCVGGGYEDGEETGVGLGLGVEGGQGGEPFFAIGERGSGGEPAFYFGVGDCGRRCRSVRLAAELTVAPCGRNEFGRLARDDRFFFFIEGGGHVGGWRRFVGGGGPRGWGLGVRVGYVGPGPVDCDGGERSGGAGVGLVGVDVFPADVAGAVVAGGFGAGSFAVVEAIGAGPGLAVDAERVGLTRGGEGDADLCVDVEEGFRGDGGGVRGQVTGFRLQVTGFRLRVTGFRFQVTGFGFGSGGGEGVFYCYSFVAEEDEVGDGLGAGLAGLMEEAALGEVEAEGAGGGFYGGEDDAGVAAVEGLVDQGVDGGGGRDLDGGDVLHERDADFAVVFLVRGVAIETVTVTEDAADVDPLAAADAVHFEVAALAVVGWLGLLFGGLGGWFRHGCSWLEEFGV